MTLLEVRDLSVEFYTEEGVVHAVDDLSYQIKAGEKFGVVGESGAGKSVTALALMRLIGGPGRITHGSIRFSAAAAIEEFVERYPNQIVDLSVLRDEYDLVQVAERLSNRNIPASALTGNEVDRKRDLVELAQDERFDLADVVSFGYGADLGLVDKHDFIVQDGSDTYIEVLRAPENALRRLRGKHIAMIFQNAQTALNPVYSVGDQIAEAMRHHFDYGDQEARERTVELLDQVGIPEPEIRYSDYPHEFSGGMQQRAVIAMALSCDPELLVADEPTTALDVTTEAKILDEIDILADEFDTAVQLITHDLGVIAELCDRVMVMYAGKPVEKASVEELFYDPKHPYTVGLMTSIPRLGAQGDRLQEIPGLMPDLIDIPSGCSFHPRCPYTEEVCMQIEPQLVNPESGEEMSDSENDRSARCLEYTGDLTHGIGFNVTTADGVTVENDSEEEADD